MKTQSLFIRMTDSALVEMVVNGQELAFSEIIRRYKSKVSGTIWLLLKEKELTKDLIQETWTKVYHLLIQGSYQETGNFVGWVCRIARNMAIDYLRSSKHKKTSDVEVEKLASKPAFQTVAADDQVIRSQKVERVTKAIKLLPEDQQIVLRMRMYEELTFKEIAEKLDISINTALGRMRYALANLKKILPEDE